MVFVEAFSLAGSSWIARQLELFKTVPVDRPLGTFSGSREAIAFIAIAIAGGDC